MRTDVKLLYVSARIDAIGVASIFAWGCSVPLFSIVKPNIEFNFLLPTKLQKLSSIICITVRIVQGGPKNWLIFQKAKAY